MPYISPAVIAEAKKIDLFTYLQSYEPHELVHFSGNVYCTRSHDSLKISNGKWCWFSRGIGGRSALDYLIKVCGMSFTEAVEQIMGREATKSPAFMSSQKEAEKPREFVLPPAGRCATHVVNYLRKRGIDADILNFCMQTGRLYESHPYHNAVFVGFDKGGTAKYAVQRGIGKAAFLGDADGSDKRYSFHIPAITPNDTVHLFESAVDLLSYATLQTLCGRNWQEDNLLSLSGVYQPKKQLEESSMPAALGQYLSDYPHIKRIALHLDNDHTGRLATKAIQAIMPKEYEVIDEPPPSGKDYNDTLCDRLGLARTKPREKER